MSEENIFYPQKLTRTLKQLERLNYSEEDFNLKCIALGIDLQKTMGEKEYKLDDFKKIVCDYLSIPIEFRDLIDHTILKLQGIVAYRRKKRREYAGLATSEERQFIRSLLRRNEQLVFFCKY